MALKFLGNPADIYDEFVEKAAELAKQRKVGHPLQKGCEQGPIVSKVQFDKVMDYIKSGKEDGATVAAGISSGIPLIAQHHTWVEIMLCQSAPRMYERHSD